ncbi:protein folding regulator, putative [Perkinsus marinus ATCC 50983]|uniref:Protein folding regulator, putative n=1 Tax=Perkinsus marinus (strain ATCC 50983 / TXsc) TaxID=423536 RepID=C5KDK6_PERM5|nr:protein folding regulator, putative [Perkinsus marinus ATCC 50983]EER17309.1 protein folding regulator, putative [Perkinsus marinus ATCC 50983]|eukprot:XP_002785513.1 protein folding regulator, putative [Perkinsus marinus ATCC 50983]
MQPMSDERREFLQKAIEETLGTQENPNDLMKESITKLNTIITSADNGDKTNPELCAEAITALSLMDRCTDFPDCPRNLEILGGTQPLLYLATTTMLDTTVRIQAAELLALMLSNNTQVQEACFIKYDGLNKLLIRIQHLMMSSHNDEEIAPLLSALGALIRNYPQAESAFITTNGTQLIAHLLTNDYSIRVQQKVASLYRYLLADGRATIVDSHDIAEALIQLYKATTTIGDIQYYEILAGLSYELREYPGMVDAVKGRIKVILESSNKQDYQPELTTLIQTAKYTPK